MKRQVSAPSPSGSDGAARSGFRRAPKRSGARSRNRRSAEARLLPIAIGLWVFGLIAFIAAFALGNTGSGTTMTVVFIAGIVVATIAEVGAFLVALASVVSYRKHRPWNVLVLVGSVVLSPATLLLVVQYALGA